MPARCCHTRYDHYELDFTWHEIAKIWQKPGDGERHIEETYPGDVAAARMTTWGIPKSAAGVVALGQRPDMARAILALYRSENTLAERGRNPSRAARTLPDFWTGP
jgi:hypothetical protein